MLEREAAFPYYGVRVLSYKYMDSIYMFGIIVFGLLGGLFSTLLGFFYFKKECKTKKADMVSILYTHISLNNFLKSVVAVMYGVVVLNSSWVSHTFYKLPNRTRAVVKNNDSYIYCNVMGPLQGITIVQGVILLSMLCCFKVATKWFPHVTDFINRRRRIPNLILGIGWAISIFGALCTFIVHEEFYMDNLSGFCYTTEDTPTPGVGIFFYMLPPLVSCVVILVCFVVMIYEYIVRKHCKKREETEKEEYKTSRMVIILIYTAVFVLCEAFMWLIYFIHNAREGAVSFGIGANRDENEYYYGLFYFKYVEQVLRFDFGFSGPSLYMAMLYYPMYIQLSLTIETFIQTVTLLVLQDDIRDWLWKIAVNRNMMLYNT